MKRLPLFVSILLFAALCMSATYWAMQWLKPPQRPVAAPPQVAQAEPSLIAAAGLFGGRAVAAVASNYQLKGVVAAALGKESAAILSADGKPAQAYRVGAEVAPGVSLKEVHPQYVLLSENGVMKRVELPANAKMAGKPEGVSNTQPTPAQANMSVTPATIVQAIQAAGGQPLLPGQMAEIPHPRRPQTE